MLSEQEKSHWVKGILAGKRIFVKRGKEGSSLIGTLVTVDFDLAQGESLLGGITSLDDLTPPSQYHFLEQSVFLVTDYRVHKEFKERVVAILDGRYPVSIYRLRNYRTGQPFKVVETELQLI